MSAGSFLFWKHFEGMFTKTEKKIEKSRKRFCFFATLP